MHHFYSLNWYTEANKIHLNVHQAVHYRRLGLVMSICMIPIDMYKTVLLYILIDIVPIHTTRPKHPCCTQVIRLEKHFLLCLAKTHVIFEPILIFATANILYIKYIFIQITNLQPAPNVLWPNLYFWCAPKEDSPIASVSEKL